MALRRASSCLADRQRLHETQPLEAVVVLVAIEMRGDEHAQPPQRPLRQQEGDQQRDRRAEEQRLQRRAPLAGVLARVVRAAHGDADIQAQHDQCRGVERELPRNEHARRAEPASATRRASAARPTTPRRRCAARPTAGSPAPSPHRQIVQRIEDELRGHGGRAPADRARRRGNGVAPHVQRGDQRSQRARRSRARPDNPGAIAAGW